MWVKVPPISAPTRSMQQFSRSNRRGAGRADLIKFHAPRRPLQARQRRGFGCRTAGCGGHQAVVVPLRLPHHAVEQSAALDDLRLDGMARGLGVAVPQAGDEREVVAIVCVGVVAGAPGQRERRSSASAPEWSRGSAMTSTGAPGVRAGGSTRKRKFLVHRERMRFASRPAPRHGELGLSRREPLDLASVMRLAGVAAAWPWSVCRIARIDRVSARDSRGRAVDRAVGAHRQRALGGETAQRLAHRRRADAEVGRMPAT